MSGPIRITREPTPDERIAEQQAKIERLERENADLKQAVAELTLLVSMQSTMG